LLFYFFEEKNIHFDAAKVKSFFLLLNWGVLLTVFLSVLWSAPPILFYIVGFAGAVAQLLAFHELYLLLKKHFGIVEEFFGRIPFFLLKFAGIMLILKLIMQLFSAFPFV